MPKVTAEILKNYHINIANLANNHSMDLGISGIKDTINNLTKIGISPIGLSDFSEKIIQMDNKEFVFIGASPHKNTLSIFDNIHLQSMIYQHKKLGRIVIITAHLGREGENAYTVKNEDEFFLGFNRGNSVKIAHQMIDYGADAFIAHGPHVMRPLEIYKNRLIAYSLGNFLTYGSFNLKGRSAFGGIIQVNFKNDGEFDKGTFFATEQTKDSYPQLWQKGIALQASKKSLSFLKDITENHQKNTFIWDDNGNFKIKK